MLLSIQRPQLFDYVVAQLNTFFPDNAPLDPSLLQKALDDALERMEFCFSRINGKGFSKEGSPYFNHLHSDHYAMFLYLLSNSVYSREGDSPTCEKLFYLNKCLHGIDCFYSVQLPSIFLFMHPIGTILGKADYSDYFFVSQNCTLGDNFDGQYPKLGKGVALYASSTVIGDCTVGDNCILAAHSYINQLNIDSNSLVFGQAPNQVIRENPYNVIKKHFT